jgi:hypothetical protein
VERASAEVAEEAEWEETEEKVRSGEEYEEIAGVAGTDGDGDEARTGSDRASSRDCGSSMTCEVAERILKPQLLSHQSRGGCLNGQSFDRRLLACALDREGMWSPFTRDDGAIGG